MQTHGSYHPFRLEFRLLFLQATLIFFFKYFLRQINKFLKIKILVLEQLEIYEYSQDLEFDAVQLQTGISFEAKLRLFVLSAH